MHPLGNMQRHFVLLSGGIDSGTCLSIAIANAKKFGGEVEAVSVDYGQRHIKETECAKDLCKYHNVTHTVLDAAGALGRRSMLTDASQEVPDISYDEIKGVSPTYVPFRNGFMLSLIAAHAQQYVQEVAKELAVKRFPKHEPLNDAEIVQHLEDLCTIYFGAHSEDAKNWAYPDCTPEFIGSMANAIYIGTYRAVRLLTPLAFLTKDEIIRKGWELGTPYHLTWSCYKGEEKHCGVCPTCRSRKDAFRIAKETFNKDKSLTHNDPTEYAL